MTWAWGDTSQKRLATCHPKLVRAANAALVMSPFDLKVLEGHRNKARQNELFDAGKSELKWPKSKHNSDPSLAIDIIPLPVDWNNAFKFHILAGVMFAAAKVEGVGLRWGGDWDGDWSRKDQTFHDLPHFELKGF